MIVTDLQLEIITLQNVKIQFAFAHNRTFKACYARLNVPATNYTKIKHAVTAIFNKNEPTRSKV